MTYKVAGSEWWEDEAGLCSENIFPLSFPSWHSAFTQTHISYDLMSCEGACVSKRYPTYLSCFEALLYVFSSLGKL